MQILYSHRPTLPTSPTLRIVLPTALLSVGITRAAPARPEPAFQHLSARRCYACLGGLRLGRGIEGFARIAYETPASRTPKTKRKIHHPTRVTLMKSPRRAKVEPTSPPDSPEHFFNVLSDPETSAPRKLRAAGWCLKHKQCEELALSVLEHIARTRRRGISASLQDRAHRLLAKYGRPKSPDTSDPLSPGMDVLLSPAKWGEWYGTVDKEALAKRDHERKLADRRKTLEGEALANLLQELRTHKNLRIWMRERVAAGEVFLPEEVAVLDSLQVIDGL
jgi:hypothetical protein